MTLMHGKLFYCDMTEIFDSCKIRDINVHEVHEFSNGIWVLKHL